MRSSLRYCWINGLLFIQVRETLDAKERDLAQVRKELKEEIKGLQLKVTDTEETLLPQIDFLKESLIAAEEKIREQESDLALFEECKAEVQAAKAEFLAVEAEKERIFAEMRGHAEMVKILLLLVFLFIKITWRPCSDMTS